MQPKSAATSPCAHTSSTPRRPPVSWSWVFPARGGEGVLLLLLVIVIVIVVVVVVVVVVAVVVVVLLLVVAVVVLEPCKWLYVYL